MARMCADFRRVRLAEARCPSPILHPAAKWLIHLSAWDEVLAKDK
jgi:hypothetical protein